MVRCWILCIKVVYCLSDVIFIFHGSSSSHRRSTGSACLVPSDALTVHVLMDRTVPSHPSPAGPTPRAPPQGPLLSLWHPEFPDSSAQLCGLLGNILSLAAWTLTACKVGTGRCLRVDTARSQAHSSVASVSPDSQLLWCCCLGAGTLTWSPVNTLSSCFLHLGHSRCSGGKARRNMMLSCDSYFSESLVPRVLLTRVWSTIFQQLVLHFVQILCSSSAGWSDWHRLFPWSQRGKS